MELKDMEQLRNLVMRERGLAVSDREWQHRLRGHGYDVRSTEKGRVISSLLRERDLITIPGLS
ncbi:MAG: hypothetical protein AAFY35_02185 [Pseudomonadota bacterium]